MGRADQGEERKSPTRRARAHPFALAMFGRNVSLGLARFCLCFLAFQFQLRGELARGLRGGLGARLGLETLLDVVHRGEALHELVHLELKLLNRPAEELRLEEGGGEGLHLQRVVMEQIDEEDKGALRLPALVKVQLLGSVQSERALNHAGRVLLFVRLAHLHLQKLDHARLVTASREKKHTRLEQHAIHGGASRGKSHG